MLRGLLQTANRSESLDTSKIGYFIIPLIVVGRDMDTKRIAKQDCGV